METMLYCEKGLIIWYRTEKNLFVEGRFTVYVNILHSLEYYPRRTVNDQYEASVQSVVYDCLAKNEAFIGNNIVLYTNQILREKDEEITERFNLRYLENNLITGDSMGNLYDKIGYTYSSDQNKIDRLEILEKMMIKK